MYCDSETRFFNNFVAEHQNELPEILDANQDNSRFDEYNFLIQTEISV